MPFPSLKLLSCRAAVTRAAQAVPASLESWTGDLANQNLMGLHGQFNFSINRNSAAPLPLPRPSPRPQPRHLRLHLHSPSTVLVGLSCEKSGSTPESPRHQASPRTFLCLCVQTDSRQALHGDIRLPLICFTASSLARPSWTNAASNRFCVHVADASRNASPGSDVAQRPRYPSYS